MKTCPECGSEEIYEDECNNINCDWCGCLCTWCEDCDWTDHPYCTDEEEE